MTDPFAHLDAAYVLGALDAAERRGFEEHLETCAQCRARVAEIAGMPARLAVLDPDTDLAGILADTDDLADAGPVPDTLLPSLVRAAGVTRRRRRLYTVSGALVAAACIAVLLAVLFAGGAKEPSTPALAGAVPMTQVIATPVHAEVALAAQGTGTRVTLQCHYEAGSGPRLEYRMVVVGPDGSRRRLSSWYIRPGEDVTFTATTELARNRIHAVEVTLADGRPILRLTT